MTNSSSRDILRQHGLRPRKSLGQHFIRDHNILERMVDAAELAPGDVVVEVGAGLGALTRVLAGRVGPAGRVLALETDGALAPLLRAALADCPAAEPVHADVLDWSPGQLGLEPGGYLVVANLPYYITSAVLRHFLAAEARPRRLVLMVQREVAQRVVAQPPHTSLLAVSVQVYARPQVVLRVPAGAFVPRPAVDSAVLRLDVYPAPAISSSPAEFFAVVRAGFGQRRKQLRNALAAGLARPAPAIDAALAAAAIDGRRRAETLALAEWDRLSAALIASAP